MIIAVEEDSAAKLTYDEFRSCFLGCIHAFACDGSDSVFLYYKGQWMVKAAIHKNATQTAGVGFREENGS